LVFVDNMMLVKHPLLLKKILNILSSLFAVSDRKDRHLTRIYF
jgi:hypothetical protein